MQSAKGRVMVCAATVAVSAFLPWAQVLGISVAGTKGDGRITLALGIAGALLALYGRGARYARRTQILLAVACIWVAAYHFGGIAGGGVYATLAASIAWLVFAWRGRPASSAKP